MMSAGPNRRIPPPPDSTPPPMSSVLTPGGPSDFRYEAAVGKNESAALAQAFTNSHPHHQHSQPSMRDRLDSTDSDDFIILPSQPTPNKPTPTPHGKFTAQRPRVDTDDQKVPSTYAASSSLNPLNPNQTVTVVECEIIPISTVFCNFFITNKTLTEINNKTKEVSQLRERARHLMTIRDRQIEKTGPVHLRELVRRQRLLMEEQRKCVNKRREKLKLASEILKEHCSRNSEQDGTFLEAYERYNYDRQELQSLDRRLKLRKHKMCRQLLHIFPFRRVRTPVNSSKNATQHNQLMTEGYEIRNMALPSRVDRLLEIAAQGGNEEEKMSIGMGYIAHLCTLLSRYLQIPLRHQIICRGSRSYIVDCFIEAEKYASQREGKKTKWDPQYPLFSKDNRRERFKGGIELLREDICQLCTQCKIRDYHASQFIQNIRIVLYTMALARPS